MSNPKPTPRPPREGDPFANPHGTVTLAEAMADKPAKKVRRKRGYKFFLSLLAISGVIMLATLMFFANIKTHITDFYQEIVVPRGIPEALPPDYPIEKAKHLVQTLHAFFGDANDGLYTDEQTLTMMGKVEEVLADRIITEQEAQALLDTVNSLQRADDR